MFRTAKTTRDQGDIGLTFAIFKLTQLGYPVSLPITDNNIYDLIVDIDGKFKSVQVKTSACLTEAGNYEVQIRRVRSNKTENKIHHFDNTEVDLLFIMVENGDSYIIPSEEVSVKSSLTLYKKYDKYKLMEG